MDLASNIVQWNLTKITSYEFLATLIVRISIFVGFDYLKLFVVLTM